MRAAKPSRPRTKPPEERREELMNAAQALFLEHGVGPTTIEQITIGADVAKGTFYLYFASKEDILAALADRFAQDLLVKVRAASSAPTDWRGKLVSWCSACAAGYLDSIRLHDILFYGSRPASREGLVDNTVIDDLTALFQAGADGGAWQVEAPRFTAVFLFSGLHAVVDDAFSKEKQVDRDRLLRRVEEICLQTVGPAVSTR